ncbi:MAG TPA: hypothetical protein DDW86_00335 [Clostridiales bacterium]|nr:hypothetical protein [Clostridiales bacterium]
MAGLWKHNKAFSRIFLSYLILLAIPMIVLGAVHYYQTLKIMEDKIEKDSLAALQQSSDTVDSFVEGLYRISSEFSLNQRLHDFLYTKAESARDLSSLARPVMLDLRKYTILNNFIGDIYIYSRKNNSIVSPTGLYTPEIFFSCVYPHTSDQAEFGKWTDAIRKADFRKTIPVTVNTCAGNIDKKILFKDSLPNAQDNLGCILVLMNQDRYLDTFSEVLKGYHGSLYILGHDRRVIVSENPWHGTDITEKNLRSRTAAETIATSEGKVLKVHITSTKNNWRYVSIIPYNAFIDQVKILKLSTICIIVLFGFFAFMISFFAANRNYAPIRNIIQFIQTAYGDQAEEKDDYQVISNIIQSSSEEIKSNQKIMKRYIPVIRQRYLAEIIGGDENCQESQSDSMNQLLGIRLDFTVSAVALFHVKMKETADKKQDGQKELYKIALCNAIEEVVKDHCVGYAVEMGHNTIACICGSDVANPDSLQENLYALATKLKKDPENKLDIVLSAGIGNIYKGHMNLSRSYEEAEEALHYAGLMNEEIVYYNDILKNDNLFAFPVSKEIQLINAIKSGKQEEALEVVSSVYNENCLHKQLTYEMMKLFLYDLYCSVVKAMEELSLKHCDSIFQSIRELDNPDNGHRDMSYFLLDIKEKVIQVCKEIKIQQSERPAKLEKGIRVYIDEHFLDHQLSLERLADVFHVTPQYLSRFFREHFCKSYVDYVNEKRVVIAKDYLLGNEKVKDAAVKSGFNNVGTFINAFRKCTGFTPGEFRNASQ